MHLPPLPPELARLDEPRASPLAGLAIAGLLSAALWALLLLPLFA
jgi:hypothetical protein